VERLSASDVSSLLAERGPIHVHVGGTLVVEGPPPGFERLLEHVDSRLALVPRFRQRVTEAPLKLSNPSWQDDPRFDLRWHVRRRALPAPGSTPSCGSWSARSCPSRSTSAGRCGRST
jgi:diacylglycerol O-acyltransferase